MKNLFTYKTGIHKSQKVIFIQFKKNYTLLQEVRKIQESRWFQQKKSWYVLDNDTNRTLFNLELERTQQPTQEGFVELEKFKKHLQSKLYSQNT